MNGNKAVIYLDETYSLRERIEDLLSRMSLEEKVSQLVNAADEIARLGVKEYNWWCEALHGVARAGEATVFPQAIGLAATFDEKLLYEVAAVIAEEARAKYNEFQRQGEYGIYQGLTFWSPNINIFRDPRWGRGHETYGEDPYLTGRMGCAFVKGLQQTDGKHLKAAACAKHFAVHSGPEKGRNSFSAAVSQKDLFETYLYAFEELVCEAGVEAVMGAYNALDGQPCCANRTLLIDILREKWGFKGHVVSDCGAIDHIYRHHKLVATPEEAAAIALKSGCDLNCGYTFGYLIEAYEKDLVEEEDINTALRRLLRTQFRLGFYDRQVSYDAIPLSHNVCPSHKALCKEAARRSLVLLKNDSILPLQRCKGERLAVIGPNADSLLALLGNYNGTPTESYTVLQGLQSYLGADAVFWAQGSPLYGEKDAALLQEAMQTAMQADIVLVAVGLDAKVEGEEGDTYNPDMSGDKQDIQLPAVQLELLEALRQTGKPLVVALLAGSAMAMGWAQENARAVVNAWYPGEQGGLALAELLYGDYSPSGKLPITFYQGDADLPPFASYAMRGRTYRYFKGEPLYPFGFGLSYTRFVYSDFSAQPLQGGGASLKMIIQNAGDCDARETTQIYVSREGAGEDYPIWELKGLYTLYLHAGERQNVQISLPAKAFSYVDESGARHCDCAVYRVYAGSCQPDERSRALGGGEVLCTQIQVCGGCP